MRVASTMPANDASKAVCGASERVARWKTVDAACKKGRRTRDEEGRSGRAKREDHAVKVNDKSNANATESKRALASFSANQFEATRGNKIETGRYSSVQATDSNLFSDICISRVVHCD